MKIKPIISFEGISGSGKTYFINKLKTDEQFLDTVFIKELSERDNNSFENKIINILKSKSNLFFSKGNPYTETLLLLAIKTYDYENLKNNKGLKYKFIFEDRSIDTIAIYQSILLNKDRNKRLQTSIDLLNFASLFRPVPTYSFLLIDDFQICIKRAENRNNKIFNSNEIDILQSAYNLYLEYVEYFKNRFIILDRRIFDENEIITKILNFKCSTLI